MSAAEELRAAADRLVGPECDFYVYLPGNDDADEALEVGFDVQKALADLMRDEAVTDDVMRLAKPDYRMPDNAAVLAVARAINGSAS